MRTKSKALLFVRFGLAVCFCYVMVGFICAVTRLRDDGECAHDDDDDANLPLQRRPVPFARRKLAIDVQPDKNGTPYLNMYNTAGPVPKDISYYECIQTRTVPSFQICCYEANRDKFISGSLLRSGVWEPYITRVFQTALYKYPNAWVIDIGANIGYYSLLGASMGHSVIAVEPVYEHVVRLHNGIKLNGFQQQVLVVFNALSNRHENVKMTHNEDNQGGVWMKPLTTATSLPKVRHEGDHSIVETTTLVHLLQAAQFSQAVVKIDIEGFECKALSKSKRLLQAVYVPYIFMEWRRMFLLQRQTHAPCSTADIRRLTQLLTSRGYVPHEVGTGFLLDPTRSTTSWKVGDVYWRHRTAAPLQVPY